MRNIFDQYEQQENRLTHALMCALHEDPVLRTSFVRWATGVSAPKCKLEVTEQSLPGEEGEELTEARRRSLPDGWIFNEDEDWALLIESKIGCRLEVDQVRRHRRTAERRGFAGAHLIALVAEPEHLVDAELKVDSGLRIYPWTELYKWLRQECFGSEWARKLHTYMEILEAKMVENNSLRAGTLTIFEGIPFNAESPYTYFEAKRQLRLAMDELRQRDDLHALGVDQRGPGRTAITGKASSHVWDYLQLSTSAQAKSFTEFPHLSLGLHREFVNAFVIVPNALRGDFRRKLLGLGPESFCDVFARILEGVHESFEHVKGAAPWVEVVQRRYPSVKSEPFTDAALGFDLRTAFPASDLTGRSPKHQPQWLRSTYDGMKQKNANVQLAVGVRFTYDRCPDVRTRTVLDHIAHAWIACAPLIDRLIGPIVEDEGI